LTRSFLARFVGVNLVFLLGHPAWSGAVLAEAPFIRSLLVNAALFVLPALGWFAVLPSATRSLGMRAFRALVLSTCAFFATLLIMWLLPGQATDVLAWNVTWAITNAGFVLTLVLKRNPPARRSLLPAEAVMAGVIFLASYSFYYWGATRVVPPLLDHDLEVQATGRALVMRFEPLLISDRGPMDYYFAHPPLLHFYAGGSFLLYGEIEALRFYDELSQRARDRRTGAPIEPLQDDRTFGLFGRRNEQFRVVADERDHYLVVSELGGEPFPVPADEVDVRRNFAHFLNEPHLLESRTPNVFFGALGVALLAIWAGRISRRWWMGAVVAVAYATGSEVFVRSSYSGYFALGALISLMMLLASDRWKRPTLSMLTGLFAAIADHKLVLLPVAYGVRAVMRVFGPLRRLDVGQLFNPKIVGFVLGTAIFWTFGLAIDPMAFIRDHLGHHLIDRLTQENPLGYEGYPSVPGLWWEFFRHTGIVLVPFALLLLAVDLAGRTRALPAHVPFWKWPVDFVGGVLRSITEPAPGRRPARELWLIYIVISAVAFTIVDWRMTKHLAPILVPLHLALVPDRDAARWRWAVAIVVLIITLVSNATMLHQLVTDFWEFDISPGW
jgi:hypothetical protein